MDLKQLRDGIDEIDEKILKLFLERMELCRSVAEYKRVNALPVFQGNREEEIISRIKKLTPVPDLESGTAALFTTIMDISKSLQNQSNFIHDDAYALKAPDFKRDGKIVCQGVEGANSETAARMIFGDRPLTFMPTFEDVFSAVEKKEAAFGIVPMQNSTSGSVDPAYDLMGRYSVYIVKNVCVNINHCLAVRRGIRLEDISCVYSHPQALAQCSEFIAKKGLATANYANTAMAAEFAAASEDKIAAICSPQCAERLGLDIIADNIADCSLNRTRFICISDQPLAEPQSDVISVMLKIPHTEGSLYRLLSKFYINGLNLCRIESRPVKDGSFDVLFYLDFAGSVADKNIRALLSDLSANLEYFRFLGTFKND